LALCFRDGRLRVEIGNVEDEAKTKNVRLAIFGDGVLSAAIGALIILNLLVGLALTVQRLRRRK
jgi:hypothetical protein